MPIPMTLHDLNATVGALITELRIGQGSVNRSTAYHDYVALEFAVFVQPNTAELIERRFRTLCAAHGWECLTVSTGRGNAVFVTMHESNIISSVVKNMPCGGDDLSWTKVEV